MADKKALVYTHEQDLGPGVTRTPGYPVEDDLGVSGISDRRVNHLGEPADHPTLSTYDGPVNGLAKGPDSDVPKPRMVITEIPNAGDGPDSKVATPKAASGK